MAVALDSSVVVGFLDRSDDLHAVAGSEVRGIARELPLVVSVITYAEVMTGVRLGHHDEGRVRGFFEDVVSRILPVDLAVGDRAASLRARNKSLAMPDALIAATVELDPDTLVLVTGDKGLADLRDLDCELVLLSPGG